MTLRKLLFLTTAVLQYHSEKEGWSARQLRDSFMTKTMCRTMWNKQRWSDRCHRNGSVVLTCDVSHFRDVKITAVRHYSCLTLTPRWCKKDHESLRVYYVGSSVWRRGFFWTQLMISNRLHLNWHLVLLVGHLVDWLTNMERVGSKERGRSLRHFAGFARECRRRQLGPREVQLFTFKGVVKGSIKHTSYHTHEYKRVREGSE